MVVTDFSSKQSYVGAKVAKLDVNLTFHADVWDFHPARVEQWSNVYRWSSKQNTE